MPDRAGGERFIAVLEEALSEGRDSADGLDRGSGGTSSEWPCPISPGSFPKNDDYLFSTLGSLSCSCP